jgi:LmbE family N-acetylglucosaminyl deacetylase
MVNFKLAKEGEFTILCLGAHADDIEIGCGGSILKLLKTMESITVYWVVFSSEGVRAQEARNSANEFLAAARSKTVLIHDYRGSFFPYIGQQIKEAFEELKKDCRPDLIFTHYRHDLHQDHRVISELTWNSFRDHTIFEYEIPKYDGDLGSPNMFIHLDQPVVEAKVDAILKHFPSQRSKQWFDRDTFLAMLRLRGVESNAPHKFAEAFHSRKAVLT